MATVTRILVWPRACCGPGAPRASSAEAAAFRLGSAGPGPACPARSPRRRPASAPAVAAPPPGCGRAAAGLAPRHMGLRGLCPADPVDPVAAAVLGLGACRPLAPGAAADCRWATFQGLRRMSRTRRRPPPCRRRKIQSRLLMGRRERASGIQAADVSIPAVFD